jgi:hypothetical protein
VVSTHKRRPPSPPHTVRPVAQVVVQRPAEHSSPAAHARPQAPQWLGSAPSVAHSRPQRFCPLGHRSVQAPETQASPLPHATAHPPQFSRSVRVSTQPLAQRVCIAPHVVFAPVSIVTEASTGGAASGLVSTGGEHADASAAVTERSAGPRV